jgi:hypothetical protein
LADGDPLPDGRGALPAGLLCAALGSITVYAALFATGLALYGRTGAALLLAAAGLLCGVVVARVASSSMRRV